MNFPDRKEGGGHRDFGLHPGALWITPSGETIRIEGFHARWLSEHPGVAKGAANVAEFILATGWAAATLFGEGHLELILKGLCDGESRELAWEILSRNAGLWRRVILMALDREGQLDLRRENLADRDAFERSLDGD
jgi:hypothetical protein